ncbi:MAG: hypothetical protein IGS03_07995 [Candidatus Sericytochromatia bacterium]|nr:hypothetical protein [Candidatus Sericytochromatia bacterium]
MFKHKHHCYRTFLALSLSAAFLLSACQASPPNVQTGTLNQQATQPGRIQINNDQAQLAERVAQKDEKISVKSAGFQTQQLNPLDLTLVAEVAPPNIQGRQVQATNVFVKDNLAYVSYGVAGDEFAGGAYIIDISKPREPKVMSEMLSSDTEFYAVFQSGNQAYFSGASLRPDLQTPAILQALELNAEGTQFSRATGYADLPSYAATDVAALADAVYVTSGDKLGGVSMLDRQTLKPLAFYPLEDARSLSVDFISGGTPKIAAFKGSGGELHILDSKLQAEKRFAFPGTATIPVSKSTLEIADNLAVIGAGDGGTLSVNLETGETLSQIHGAGEKITNGASVDGPFVFMAEGFDGIGVARLEEGTPRRLGTLDLKLDASANMVAFHNNVLFVANGSGGLRILTLDTSPPVSQTPQADIVFILDGGNSPSTNASAVYKRLEQFIDKLKQLNADVTYAVANTATNHTRHPDNDPIDATALVLDATTDTEAVKAAIRSHPHIGGTSMDTYSALVETLANPTAGTRESDQVTRRQNKTGTLIPLIQVLITDHGPEQLRGQFINYPKPTDAQRQEDVARFLQAGGAQVHLLIKAPYFSHYARIAENTQGSLTNAENLDAVDATLQALLDQLAPVSTAR